VLETFARVLDEIETTEGPRALVTHASGKVWSNGLDLAWMMQRGGDPAGYLEQVHRLLGRIIELGVPTVAAVTGHAFGAGAMLSLCHDVTVMRADRGYWCLPEVDLGMFLLPGEQAVVTAKLPPATVNEALTTGRRYSGPEARAAGIVHEVASESDVVARAVAIASERADKATGSLAAIKRGLYGDIADQLRRDMADFMGGDDAGAIAADFLTLLRGEG
jgi:enoyl-CoA hydratase/carnithine racemase